MIEGDAMMPLKICANLREGGNISLQVYTCAIPVDNGDTVQSLPMA